MSISVTEKIGSLKELLPNRNKIAAELSSRAVDQSVSLDNEGHASPNVIASRIEEVKTMTGGEIDIQLAHLVALTRDNDLIDTQEIPPILTDAIHDTAEMMVRSWQDEDYTQLAVVALTDAYAITHDDTLIEKAVEVVNNDVHFAEYLPDVAAAVELAAQTGEEFDASINHIISERGRREIQFTVEEKSKIAATNDPYQKIGPEYEWLFDPNSARKTK